MTLRWCALLLASPLLLLSREGVAQNHAQPGYVVDRWTAETGLPQNSVNAITQTPDGYLWLTTYGGLVRFDGVTFTLYSAARHPGIHSDRALGICVAPDSSLWVGTEDGLTHYAHGRFETFTSRDGLPSGPILGISCDPSGDVWLAMDRQGVVRWRNGKVRRFPLGRGSGGVNTIVADGHGNAWLGLWFEPPMLLRPTDSVVVPRPQDAPPGAIGPMPPGSIHDSSMLWRAADGFWVRDARGLRHVVLPPAILHQYAALAIPRSDGGLWVAEAGGVAGVDPAGRYAFHAAPGVGMRFRTRSIFTDRQGTTWVGTETIGLLRLRPRLFTVLTTDDGLSSNLPMGIAGDDEGRVYVGSNCANVTVLDHGRATVYDGHREPRAIRGCAWSLLHGPGDTIWIGTYGGPVMAWHGRTARIYGEKEGLPTGLAVGLYLDHHGELWAGTLSAGLGHLHRGRFITYDTTSGLPSDQVNVITETRAGVMWVGTANGVARRDGERFTPFTSANGLAKGPIRSIYEAPDGALWFGSYGGGLSRLKDGRFVTITADDGLFEDVVSSLTLDPAGYLWTTGNHGIARVSRHELDAFADGKIRAVHAVGYGTADGLLN
ncbi:MAG: ligand-binding sensor domain-containing protein, partial [Gemmatimonadales bacterium]